MKREAIAPQSRANRFLRCYRAAIKGVTPISTSDEAFEHHPAHGTTRDNLCTVK
jgi:hypothetical protein